MAILVIWKGVDFSRGSDPDSQFLISEENDLAHLRAVRGPEWQCGMKRTTDEEDFGVRLRREISRTLSRTIIRITEESLGWNTMF